MPKMTDEVERKAGALLDELLDSLLDVDELVDDCWIRGALILNHQELWMSGNQIVDL
jgi:hypothetical protein